MPASLVDGRLYAFIFGVGLGESVAVRIPPDEWLVIDSCRIAKRAAALSVLRRYGGKLTLLLLTHSHRDHYRGFADLITEGEWNRIGCNDWRVIDLESANTADPEAQQTAGELAQVLAGIRNQWRIRPTSQLVSHRGASCAVGEGTFRVLHPDQAFAVANRHGEPNNLSSAAILEWKGFSLLFGADVENPHWIGIATHRLNLGSHLVLKVPHHASREAQHDCFLAGGSGRSWFVTPYNLNAGLPRFEDDQGAALLLRYESVIHLTGLPVRHAQQHDAPCETTRQDLLNGVRPQRMAFQLLGGIVGVEQATEPETLSCYIGVSVDETGAREMFHGPGSVSIREAEPGPPIR